MRLQDWCITVVNITTSARLVGRSGTAFRLLAEFWGSVPPVLMFDGNAAERLIIVSFKWSAVALPDK